MNNLVDRLIKLGTSNPELRKDIRPILDVLTSDRFKQASAGILARVAALLPYDYDTVLVSVSLGTKTPYGMDRYGTKRFSVSPEFKTTGPDLERFILSAAKKYPKQRIKVYGLHSRGSDSLLDYDPKRGFEAPDYNFEVSNLSSPTRPEVALWVTGRGERPNLLGQGKQASLEGFDFFDLEEEEVLETPRTKWDRLGRHAVVIVGSTPFTIFKSEGSQKYATKSRSKGRKQYLLTPLTRSDDPEIGVYEVVGSQAKRELLLKGRPKF